MTYPDGFSALLAFCVVLPFIMVGIASILVWWVNK